MYTLELTEEELEFVYTRCLRKAMRLEDAHLKDVPCYELATQIMWKIYDAKKLNAASSNNNVLEITRFDYEKLKQSGQINPDITYVIKKY